MTDLLKRLTQTAVKHEILQQYLEAWRYIVTSGLSGVYEKANRTGRHLVSRFVYVDCFSFTGQYAPENNQAIYGSPVIGIASMDQLKTAFQERNIVAPEVFTILVEKERDNYQALLRTLHELGYGDRVKETSDFYKLKSGEIAVINGDYQDYLDRILAFTSRDYTWSFYFVDPYGPKSIPLSAVSRIVNQRYADVIINLPYQDLHKKTGSAAKEEPDPNHVPILEQYDAVYGNQAWRNIAQNYYSDQIDRERMEDELVTLYQQVLSDKSTDLAVKRIPLKFEDKERTMFYLFLTTHDGTGALKMNEILMNAKIREYDYRERARSSRTGQLSLFAEIQDPSRPINPEQDLKEIADEIFRLCKGESISFRSVLARLANTPYYEVNVRKAMTILKKSGKCSYSTLGHKEIITFVR